MPKTISHICRRDYRQLLQTLHAQVRPHNPSVHTTSQGLALPHIQVLATQT